MQAGFRREKQPVDLLLVGYHLIGWFFRICVLFPRKLQIHFHHRYKIPIQLIDAIELTKP